MPATNEITRLLNRIPPHFSALERVSMLVVADDTPPTLRRLAKREWTRAHAALRQAEANRGVRFAGLPEVEPYPIASIEDLVSEAVAEDERLARCPRARFCRALGQLAHDKYAAKAEEVRGVYTRDLSDERKPLNISAVGTAVALLNTIPGEAARECLDALAELLMGDVRRAA